MYMYNGTTTTDSILHITINIKSEMQMTSFCLPSFKFVTCTWRDFFFFRDIPKCQIYHTCILTFYNPNVNTGSTSERKKRGEMMKGNVNSPTRT